MHHQRAALLLTGGVLYVAFAGFCDIPPYHGVVSSRRGGATPTPAPMSYPGSDDMEAVTPPANVYEGNGQLSVAAPIPGAHPDQVEVIVMPTRLRITAVCKYPQENQHYHRHEWRVGAWELAVDLPRQVDPAAARATLNLGVLVVMAPISATGSGESRPTVT